MPNGWACMYANICTLSQDWISEWSDTYTHEWRGDYLNVGRRDLKKTWANLDSGPQHGTKAICFSLHGWNEVQKSTAHCLHNYKLFVQVINTGWGNKKWMLTWYPMMQLFGMFNRSLSVLLWQKRNSTSHTLSYLHGEFSGKNNFGSRQIKWKQII